MDGKNRIYDEQGNLLLLPNENLLTKHYFVTMNVTESWRSFYIECVIAMEAGPFKCFLTNQRVVFTRRPNPYKAGAYLMTPLGAPEGIAKAYKARMILQAGGFEYYELFFRDIRFYKVFKNCVDLFIMGDERQKNRATISNHGAKPALRVPLIDLLINKGIQSK